MDDVLAALDENDEPMPVDPWETDDDDDVPDPGFLDIEALRRRGR